MTKPLVRGITELAATTGAGTNVTRPWPAGHAAGWLATLIVISSNETVPTPTGFTVASVASPQGTGTPGAKNSIKLHAFRRLATQVDIDANGGSMPDIQVTNPDAFADSFIGWVAIFTSDGNLTTPMLVLTAGAGNVQTPASTAVSIPGGDTTGTADVLVMQIVAHSKETGNPIFDPTAWANADLVNLTERTPPGGFSMVTGSGGGFSILTGEKATGGPFGATTGLLLSSAVQARLTLALVGAASAAALPRSTRCCGAECGAHPGTAPTGVDNRHIHAFLGTPPVSQSEIARNNGRAWEFAPMANASALAWEITRPTNVGRGFLYFATLPDTDTELIRCAVTSGGNSPELRYRVATQDIVAGVGASLGTPVPVIAGRWYWISWAADASTGTRTMKLTVDGVDKGTATKAVAASIFSQFQIGASCETPTAGRVIWDDITIGPDVSLYPMGSANDAILWAQPMADGVHNISAAGDFKYEDNTDVPVGVTDSYTRLLGLLSDPAMRLKFGACASGEFLEWLMTGSLPAVASVLAMELITAHVAAGTDPNKQSLRIVDGATVADVLTDADFSETTAIYHARHWATNGPAGTALTQALFNGQKLRWGPGWGVIDITPAAGIGGLGFEVDCTLAVAPPVEETKQRNPTHVYPGPGTYHPTLTVRDNLGLESSITKTVVVA